MQRGRCHLNRHRADSSRLRLLPLAVMSNVRQQERIRSNVRYAYAPRVLQLRPASAHGLRRACTNLDMPLSCLPAQNRERVWRAGVVPREAAQSTGSSSTYVRVGDSGRRIEFHFCARCGATFTMNSRATRIVSPFQLGRSLTLAFRSRGFLSMSAGNMLGSACQQIRSTRHRHRAIPPSSGRRPIVTPVQPASPPTLLCSGASDDPPSSTTDESPA